MCGSYKNKNDRKNRKRGYENQIKGSYTGENLQRAIGSAQSSDQIRIQVSVVEVPKKT